MNHFDAVKFDKCRRPIIFSAKQSLASHNTPTTTKWLRCNIFFSFQTKLHISKNARRLCCWTLFFTGRISGRGSHMTVNDAHHTGEKKLKEKWCIVQMIKSRGSSICSTVQLDYHIDLSSWTWLDVCVMWCRLRFASKKDSPSFFNPQFFFLLF